MEHVRLQDAIKHSNDPNCTVYEYPMKNSELNIGVAEITTRYPSQGYAINHECSEIAYILKGSGILVTENKTVKLSTGDVVYIPHGEYYYWEGAMTIILPATPAWYPAQHETTLEETLK